MATDDHVRGVWETIRDGSMGVLAQGYRCSCGVIGCSQSRVATDDQGTPAPQGEPEDFAWAVERVTNLCASALIDAGVYREKLLKGFGYPNETFRAAQDYRALSIVLEALKDADRRVAEERARCAAIQDDLRWIADGCARVLAVLEKHDYKFERFPRNLVTQPPVGDGERWEAMAFHIYTELCQTVSRAESALREIAEAIESRQQEG